MQLTDAGESRINGYLFVLERSLKTFLPSDVVRDAVREIESHLRERIAAADGAPGERVAATACAARTGRSAAGAARRRTSGRRTAAPARAAAAHG